MPRSKDDERPDPDVLLKAVSEEELPSSPDYISANRYKIYSELFAELSQPRHY